MGNPTQQQRIGAQKAAAEKVRTAEGQFQKQLSTLLNESESLRPHYQGPAANSFFSLVGNWLEDADTIVKDMENFAEKMNRQESTVNAQQEQSASDFSKAATRLSTK